MMDEACLVSSLHQQMAVLHTTGETSSHPNTFICNPMNRTQKHGSSMAANVNIAELNVKLVNLLVSPVLHHMLFFSRRTECQDT